MDRCRRRVSEGHTLRSQKDKSTERRNKAKNRSLRRRNDLFFFNADEMVICRTNETIHCHRRITLAHEETL